MNTNRLAKFGAACAVALAMLTAAPAPSMAATSLATPQGVSVAAPAGIGLGYAYVGVKAGVNVRSGPGMCCHRVGGLAYGKKVFVYAQKGGWSKIGYKRWVASYLLTKYKPYGC